jgi:hypothetical protein
MKAITHRKLKVGEVRREGDETRVAYTRYRGMYGNDDPYLFERPWEPVSLIGHPILPADIVVSEFRRPHGQD